MSRPIRVCTSTCTKSGVYVPSFTSISLAAAGRGGYNTVYGILQLLVGSMNRFYAFLFFFSFFDFRFSLFQCIRVAGMRIWMYPLKKYFNH